VHHSIARVNSGAAGKDTKAQLDFLSAHFLSFELLTALYTLQTPFTTGEGAGTFISAIKCPNHLKQCLQVIDRPDATRNQGRERPFGLERRQGIQNGSVGKY
jgi:hypothetical protein